jgi:hypothetical protein
LRCNDGSHRQRRQQQARGEAEEYIVPLDRRTLLSRGPQSRGAINLRSACVASGCGKRSSLINVPPSRLHRTSKRERACGANEPLPCGPPGRVTWVARSTEPRVMPRHAPRSWCNLSWQALFWIPQALAFRGTVPFVPCIALAMILGDQLMHI